jgi:hypothetical protein
MEKPECGILTGLESQNTAEEKCERLFRGCPCATLRAGLYSASLHRAAARLGPAGNDPSPNGKNGFRIAGKSLAILNPFPPAKVFSRGLVKILRIDTSPRLGLDRAPPFRVRIPAKAARETDMKAAAVPL